MRNWRRSARLGLLAALASWSPSAGAQLLMAATPGEPPAVAHAELAYASGAGVPVTWLSLRVQRGPVAVVAALPEDAVAERALDAWLAALEVTASPNVLLPTSASGCKEGLRFAHVSWPRGAGVAETALSLTSPDDVLAALDEQGLVLDAVLPVAPRYLVWSWPEAEREQTTRTLRVVGGSAPLAFTPSGAFPVLVSTLTRGAAALPNELKDEELRVTFVAGAAVDSDYQERLRDWMGRRSEPLLEMRARGPIFDWSIYDDQISLVPLVRTYALRAAGELTQVDADACTEQLRALRQPGAPAATACAGARDAELALSAVGDELVTLQRFALVGSGGLSPAAVQPGGEASAPLLRAERWDGTQCEGAPAPVVVVQPPVKQGGGSSGSGSSRGTTTVVIEKTVYVEETPPPEVSCGSSTQSEQGYDASSRDDSCSSDTSSSSRRDDSCSSDTSSSSRRDDSCSSDTSSSSRRDDSCSSDTSSSSSERDDSCSSDSSSSSSDESASCDGSSDSGYDGDTCTASAAPGGERAQKSQASLSRARPQRLKTSLWAVGFAAALLPIRRRKRRL